GFTAGTGISSPNLAYNNGSLYGFGVGRIGGLLELAFVSAQLTSNTSDATAIGLTANSTRKYTIADTNSRCGESDNLIASSGQYTHILCASDYD
ncbi:hypothetical protein BGX27_007306, partial [Mortierella sp. AM989]